MIDKGCGNEVYEEMRMAVLLVVPRVGMCWSGRQCWWMRNEIIDVQVKGEKHRKKATADITDYNG
jgi:hypothetical protein